MKTRITSTKLLAMAVALAVLAGIWSVWDARPAQAIIIINNKTGMFTLTQDQAVRVHVVNTEEAGGIVPCTGVFDSGGNTLWQSEHRMVPLGQATTFEFDPRLAAGERMAIRLELMVEGGSGRGKGLNFIPTAEVFDTGTGRTSVGQDFIIVDN